MQLSKHHTDNFPWKSNDLKNLSCEIQDYTLRVIGKNKNYWMFQVFFKDKKIKVDQDVTNSKFRAIGLVEGIYLTHKTLKTTL